MVIQVKKSNWRRGETRYVIKNDAKNGNNANTESPVHGSASGLAVVLGVTAAAALLAISL